MYHRINHDALHGQNVVMEIHYVLIVPTRDSAPIGGVIQTMAHFCAKISIVSMRHGFAMVSSLIVHLWLDKAKLNSIGFYSRC